ncbi:hypothetical protein VTP01DRAFT_2408 [Rhizomucor pusillus]|uniref:uncharacterized protein n=1 Tax=Rhizomucor pusillus TaxID=4840 RepID=UPI003744179E
MTVAETDDVKSSLGIFYHRYTDSCLFYKHPFGGMINKKNGYMRRYSTSSIISGYSSATTATTNNIRHRKARSLGSIPLELMPPPGQQHHSHKIENRPDIICEKKAAATNITGGSTLPANPHNVMEFHSDNRMLHRIIRIERDYSLGDGVTRFSTEYPKELDGRISEQDFVATIEHINDTMLRAEKLSNNMFDNIMECLTLYIWPMLVTTHYQRTIRHLRHYIDQQNTQVYQPHGAFIADPVRSAFLFLEIRLYK